MRARAVLRIAMVVIAVGVVVAVAVSWRGRPATEPAVTDTPQEGGPVADPEVVSRTTGLRHTSAFNGVTRYELEADERVGFADNRTEFRGNIRVAIYGEPTEDGRMPDATIVVGERLQVVEREAPAPGDEYQEIRVLDDVSASLPGGVELAADALTYRDDRLTTDDGVILRIGGLVIESSNFRYDPQTDVGQLFGDHPASARDDLAGDVKLWREQDAGGPGAELSGHAGRLSYAADDGALQLRGQPVIELPDATLAGGLISLLVDEASNSLRGIEVDGGARALWLGAPSPGEHLLSADTIAVELDDAGAPSGLRASISDDDVRPRFDLGAAGSLRADVLELALDGASGGAIVARGRAYFFPGSRDGGLEHVLADVLEVGEAGVEQLAARGGVEIRLLGEDGAVAIFSGPEAQLAYRDDRIDAALWPAGVDYASGDRRLVAGQGSFDPDSGDWTLSGTPRPRLQAPEYDVDADTIRLVAGGGVQMSGAVSARLRGSMIDTIAPLFGGAPEVAAAADGLELTADGRLAFRDNARIWQADQQLLAGEIRLLPASEELQADGNVFVTLPAAAADVAGQGEPSTQTVILSGGSMLVEGSPPELRMAGGATLDMSPRLISGARITVRFVEQGGWEAVSVDGAATMSDPAGEARGEGLEYEAVSGLITIRAGSGVPASFTTSQGYDITDALGLRLEWVEDGLDVTAMQKGTTQTVRSGQR